MGDVEVSSLGFLVGFIRFHVQKRFGLACLGVLWDLYEVLDWRSLTGPLYCGREH